MAASKTTKTTEATTEAKAKTPGARKGVPRPVAVVNEIDFGATMSLNDLPTQAERQSPWLKLLETLYDATAEGKVGRDDEGELVFVKLAEYGNTNGARAQIKNLESKPWAEAYELQAVTRAGRSEVWGRVIEVAAE